jgi:hypothetical protein
MFGMAFLYCRTSNNEYRNGIRAKSQIQEGRWILTIPGTAPTSIFGVRYSVFDILKFDIPFIPRFPLSKLSKTFVCRKKNQKFLRPFDFRPESPNHQFTKSPVHQITSSPNPPINSTYAKAMVDKKSPFHDPFRTRCR